MKSILYFLPKYDYPPPEYRLSPLIDHHTPPVDMVDQLLILDLPEERGRKCVFKIEYAPCLLLVKVNKNSLIWQPCGENEGDLISY